MASSSSTSRTASRTRAERSSPPSSSSSSAIRRRASGLRRSCDALASTRRWASNDRWTRSAASLNARATAATSSRPRTATRASSSPAPQRETPSRTSSSRRVTRRASGQAPTAIPSATSDSHPTNRAREGLRCASARCRPSGSATRIPERPPWRKAPGSPSGSRSPVRASSAPAALHNVTSSSSSSLTRSSWAAKSGCSGGRPLKTAVPSRRVTTAPGRSPHTSEATTPATTRLASATATNPT